MGAGQVRPATVTDQFLFGGLFDSFESPRVDNFLAIQRALDWSGRDQQLLATCLETTNVIGTGPGLDPRGFVMQDDLVPLALVGATECSHGFEQIGSFGVC